MMYNSDFYRSRAAESSLAAANATLHNVRERCRESEAAWLTMAERASTAEAERAAAMTDKLQAVAP